MSNAEGKLLDWFVKKRIPEGYEYRLWRRFFGAEIDLWVESASEVWMIEAEKVADYSPLGQLLYYKYLYESSKMSKTLRLILVYSEPTSYTRGLFRIYNIGLETPL